MKKLFCYCMTAALIAGCSFGCSGKGSGKNSSSSAVSEPVSESTVVNNAARPFLGKWEAYKAFVLDEEYEDEYAGYPLSALMKLEIFEDHTAAITTATNPRRKDYTNDYYKWNITTEDGNDTLHINSPEDNYDCRIEQGQLIVTYTDANDGSVIYLLPVDKFSENQSTTEAGLDKVDFSGYYGKWESEEATAEGETYTETMGDYPINVAFRLELRGDSSATLSVFGESMDYEWEPDKKDELYMWDDYEGFSIKTDGDRLVLDNEYGLVIKLRKVEEFEDYDFSAAADSAPDDGAILYPEEPEETT